MKMIASGSDDEQNHHKNTIGAYILEIEQSQYGIFSSAVRKIENKVTHHSKPRKLEYDFFTIISNVL